MATLYSCLLCGQDMPELDGLQVCDNCKLNDRPVYEAMEWLLDCGCPAAYLIGVGRGEIIAEMNKQYSGGWSQFLKDIAPLEEWREVSKVPGLGSHFIVTLKSNFGNTKTRLTYR